MEFFKTKMGQTFYERSIPSILKALNEISSELKRFNDNNEKSMKNESKLVKLQAKDIKSKSTKTEIHNIYERLNMMKDSSIGEFLESYSQEHSKKDNESN